MKLSKMQEEEGCVLAHGALEFACHPGRGWPRISERHFSTPSYVHFYLTQKKELNKNKKEIRVMRC
jgi:hypothetical protein